MTFGVYEVRAEFLQRKEVRKINGLLLENFGAEFDIDSYFYFKNAKDDLFLISRAVERINIEKIREVSAGLYVGQLTGGSIRLSIEGSQILGPLSKKGIVELSDAQWKSWLQKEDIEDSRFNELSQGFYIVRHKNDYFGTGHIKDGILNSYIPKSRSVGEPH